MLGLRKKIVLSPHYDDLALSLGGLARHWQAQQCAVETWVVFSHSNYLANRLGRLDFSTLAVAEVSQRRYQEELAAAVELGVGKVERLGCYEAQFRGYAGFIEPAAQLSTLTEADREAQLIIRRFIEPLLFQSVDLFVPIALLGHYDHLLVRDTILSLLVDHRSDTLAHIFFYEDIPYAAEARWRHWRVINRLIRRWRLTPVIVPIDVESKLGLLKYYPSQQDDSHAWSIVKRGQALKRQYRLKSLAERLFALN